MTRSNWGKVGRGALLAAAGALLTFLIDAIPAFDLGQFGPFIAAGLSVLLNMVRKSIESNS